LSPPLGFAQGADGLLVQEIGIQVFRADGRDARSDGGASQSSRRVRAEPVRSSNIASIGGLIGVPHLAPYATGKFGLVGLSQAYGAEVAPYGITVTLVCPGLLRTGSPDHATVKGRSVQKYRWCSLAASHPIERSATFMGAHEVPPEYRERHRADVDLSVKQMIPAVAAGIVLVPEGRGILQRMSVFENLVIASEARRWPGGQKEARAAIEGGTVRRAIIEAGLGDHYR